MVGEFLFEGVVDDTKAGACCLKQTIGHLVRPFSPLPIRDVDKNWIYEGVSYSLPGASMDAGKGTSG
jgi:hypothetical protein